MNFEDILYVVYIDKQTGLYVVVYVYLCEMYLQLENNSHTHSGKLPARVEHIPVGCLRVLAPSPQHVANMLMLEHHPCKCLLFIWSCYQGNSYSSWGPS